MHIRNFRADGYNFFQLMVAIKIDTAFEDCVQHPVDNLWITMPASDEQL